MIKLKDLMLHEDSAGEEAKRRGLKHISFGRYADPSNPKKVVAKSVNGKLVKVANSVKDKIGGKNAPDKDSFDLEPGDDDYEETPNDDDYMDWDKYDRENQPETDDDIDGFSFDTEDPPEWVEPEVAVDDPWEDLL